MARQALGSPPMELYRQESNSLDFSIANSNARIENLTDTLATLVGKKKGAISELKILNSIIDEKRKMHVPEVMHYTI